MTNGLTKLLLACLFFCASALATPVEQAESSLLGNSDDGSRAVPVHLIPMLDPLGRKTLPDDNPMLPFSTRLTCSASCHDYNKVSGGWHFNAGDPNTPAGRPGQPWILVDIATCTQVPLSQRSWPGVFQPAQLGLTNWQFIQNFARHMPGGGIGEQIDKTDDPNEIVRGIISGKLEINCLACHDADPAHDQGQYALQVARQNFRWAAAATSAFATVTGSAKDMPVGFDYLLPGLIPSLPIEPDKLPPAVVYRDNIFDAKRQVFFNIVKKIPAQRCYFCHSNKDLDSNKPETWMTDEDVHLAAGLSCVDCHRNGIDHRIIRGYEGEVAVTPNPLAPATTCKSCHLDEKASKQILAGRFAAPQPRHAGIPPVHFDKLTCTACHSGPQPHQTAGRTKTSRAHGLGLYTAKRPRDYLPHIFSPVFAKQSDGKIAPHKLVWPAFWAVCKGDKIEPLAPRAVKEAAGSVLAQAKVAKSGDWPALTDQLIIEVLKSLAPSVQAGKPVYVAGGRVFRLDGGGKLLAEEHPAAKAYLWPLAHDVRPASQSLGSRNCQDCHSTKSAFLFGAVPVDSPLVPLQNLSEKMFRFQQLDGTYNRLFALSFVFRPWLKIFVIAACSLVSAVLLLYALKVLARIAMVLAEKD